MKKTITFLLVVVLLLASIPAAAFADAYIPPDPYYILSAHKKNSTCSPLNTFLSNFAEAGVTYIGTDSSPEEKNAVILKHIELNAKLYKDVRTFTADDGNTYMRIPAETFKKRAQRLFDESLSATDCTGYKDGSVEVTAAHFGEPIQVFASVYDCTKERSGVYRVLFEVYLVTGNFTSLYRTANKNLPQNKLSLLGSGSALVGFNGGETVESISSADFSLLEYSSDVAQTPNCEPNLSYETVNYTEPPTEATTLPPETTAATTQAPSSAVPEEKDLSDDDTPGLSLNSKLLLVLILLIVAIALFSVFIILLLIHKKKD